MSRPVTQLDFPPGTHVRLHNYPPPMFFCASLGIKGMVAHLNHTPYTTGVVVGWAPPHMPECVIFRPDGWPLPDDKQPRGFLADVSRLENWAGPATPCLITDGVGTPLDEETIKKLIEEKVSASCP